MKHFITLGLLAGSMLWSGAQAKDMSEAAKANGCYSCHANAEKVVGPAFATIAEKYQGDKDAAATLAQSIQHGSRGKFGRVPMPPHSSLAPEELKALAEWVLTVRP